MSVVFWLVIVLAIHVGSERSAFISLEQVDQLKELFQTHFQHFAVHQPSSPQELASDTQSMGSGRIDCLAADSSYPFLSLEFGLSPTHSVPIRSVSKLLASLTVLILHESNLFNINLPHGFCPETPQIFNSSIASLLSMNAHGLDGRANAFRVKQRGSTFDSLGFPPLCDELNLHPVQCVEHFLCPFYADEPEALRKAGAIPEQKIPDVSCKSPNARQKALCLQWKDEGRCDSEQIRMRDECAFVCDPDCLVGARSSDQRKEYSFKHGARVVKKYTSSCVYDNYAYTLVDAAVYKQTGKYITYWATELLFKPLDMQGTLACLATDMCSLDCLAPVENESEWFLKRYPNWAGGSFSPNWVGNAFFANAQDFHKLMRFLLNNGTNALTGQELLSPRSMDVLFSNPDRFVGKRPFGHCVGAQEFSLGMGYCKGKEGMNEWASHLFTTNNGSRLHESPLGGSMCTSSHMHFWASSYGTRFSLARDANVACVALLNMPSQFGPRAHFLQHNMSAILREVFPY